MRCPAACSARATVSAAARWSRVGAARAPALLALFVTGFGRVLVWGCFATAARFAPARVAIAVGVLAPREAWSFPLTMRATASATAPVAQTARSAAAAPRREPDGRGAWTAGERSRPQCRQNLSVSRHAAPQSGQRSIDITE